MGRALAIVLGVTLGFGIPAQANTGVERVDTRTEFVSIIDGRQLSYPGVRLTVGAEGDITGRALGRQIVGEWRWEDGYFCRDLFWGKRDLGSNCQEVTLRGQKLRFQSDRGTGDHADLTIR